MESLVVTVQRPCTYVLCPMNLSIAKHSTSDHLIRKATEYPARPLVNICCVFARLLARAGDQKNLYYLNTQNSMLCFFFTDINLDQLHSLVLTLHFVFALSKAALLLCSEQPIQQELLHNRLFSNLLVCENMIGCRWNFHVSHTTLWSLTNLLSYFRTYWQYTAN